MSQALQERESHKAPLKRLGLQDVQPRRQQVYDQETLAGAKAILDDVRSRGQDAVQFHAERLGDLPSGGKIFYTREDLSAALASIPKEDSELLHRVAGRIRAFAEAQRAALSPVSVSIPGGRAGHDILPVDSAGCYAPAGRFPLPSTVLMTVIPARVAGVKTIWVATPKPPVIMLAAAAVAGADGLLAVGGAQAIGALAYGTEKNTPCDVIVGPGSRWVTAAKQLIAGEIAIDMLAGPSELVVLADKDANPSTIAADLLAQAEHDPDAAPILVTDSETLYDAVNSELERQMATLPTIETAAAAVDHGFAVLVDSMEEGIAVCNLLAGEHLEVMTRNPQDLVSKLKHCGGMFVGEGAAEVVGDYGAGPNHTLPTGGTARSRAGLSVYTFLRARTWIDIADPSAAKELYEDSVRMARLEGLEGHARAAEKRISE
jgi:histidinol dehydrogenase